MINRDQIVYHRGGLVFGLRGNEHAHIDDVPNGLACGCVCEECRAALVARNRGLVRRSHFAHASGQTCDNTGENGLVRSAAAILAEVRTLLVAPLWTHSRHARGRVVRIDSATPVIERGKRPEVRITARKRVLRMFVRPSERTPADLDAPVREAGISAMQVAVPPDAEGIITAGRLLDALTTEPYARWWLFNARTDVVDEPDQPLADSPAPNALSAPPPIEPVVETILAVAEPPPPRAYPVHRQPGPRFCWRCGAIRDFDLRDTTLACRVCGTEFLGEQTPSKRRIGRFGPIRI